MAGEPTKRDLRQIGCYHRLEHLDLPPYRYRCVICGKKLKIASGFYPPKNEVVHAAD